MCFVVANIVKIDWLNLYLESKDLFKTRTEPQWNIYDVAFAKIVGG